MQIPINTGLLVALTLWSPFSVLHAATLEPGEVGRSVEKYLEEKLQTEGPEGLSVASVYYRFGLPLKEGKITWKIDFPTEERTPGRHYLPVTALVNGTPEANFQVSVVLNKKIKIPVVSHTLKRGDIVTEADIRWQKLELVRMDPGLILKPEELIGKSANRLIKEKSPLQEAWFERPLAVDRGQKINIWVTNGALSIQTTGISMDKGHIGDQIEIRNPESRKRFMAKITGPGEAQVDN
ncbi:MAG: flagellar basal body P-ring formation chaperone FlgA [Magnetococcus sp. DMHC-6]